MIARRAAETQDLDRVGFVTRYFNSLQGLGTVGLGLNYIFMTMDHGLHLAGVAHLLPFLIVGLELLVLRRAGRYYKTRFGEVKTRPLRLEPWIVWAMLFLLGGWDAVVVVADKDTNLTWNGLVSVFMIGTWCFRGYRFSQSYYLALGLFVLSAPFLMGHLRILEMLGGAALIVAGLLDHWQLVQTLSHGAAFERDAMSETEVEA